MDNGTREELRSLLFSQRDRLLAMEASRMDSAKTVELDQTRQGRLSRMDALQGQAMARATLVRARHQVKRIDAALKRSETEDFGLCRECGEEIDLRRLRFDPTAVFCISCAEEQESR